MRVLVTGSAGFVGTNLCARLEQDGNEVVRFDLKQGSDIRETQVLAAAARGCHAIVHLAAESGVSASQYRPRNTFSVNVDGTLSVLDAARRAGVEHVVAASTGGAIAGNTPPPVSEDTVPAPLSPYGASKLAMEGLLSAFRGSYGLATCALRFTNVYGPHSAHKSGAVATFIKALRQDAPLVVYGDGLQVRDYVYVDDVISGIELALKRRAVGVYMLGSGVGTSLTSLIGTLVRVSGRSHHDVERRTARPGEVAKTWADISKARAGLLYRPEVTLEHGLRRTWEWFGSQ